VCDAILLPASLHDWGKDVKYRGNLFSISTFLEAIADSKAHGLRAHGGIVFKSV
jgi:hypothetical protein